MQSTEATGVQYFPNGALKQFTYGNGLVHTLTQNERGLPETSRDAFGSNVVIDDTYLYDRNGNVLAIGDGLPGNPGDREMTYDLLDRLSTVNAGSAQGGIGTFAYDGLDNIRRLDQGARTVRHQYATADLRLTSIQDSAGATLFNYGYDNRGNQISRTKGSNTDTFTFDAANRLTAASIFDSGAATGSSYVYDAFGRRVKETTGGLATYSGYGQEGQLIHQLDQKVSPMLSTDYVYLAGSLVAKRTTPVGGVAVTTYLHTDALGSPVASTDALGSVTWNRQTAYGSPADGTWDSGPGFTGHVVDRQSRLVYMQQRYYDPSIGRFLSADPVGVNPSHGGNFGRYWYANGNPARFTDPDGRKVQFDLARGATNDDLTNAMSYLSRSATFSSKMDSLTNSTEIYTILVDPTQQASYDHESRTITWNPVSGLVVESTGEVQSPAMGLAHEVIHGAHQEEVGTAAYLEGNDGGYEVIQTDQGVEYKMIPSSEEVRATAVEGDVARELGEPVRADYGDTGDSVPTCGSTSSEICQ